MSCNPGNSFPTMRHTGSRDMQAAVRAPIGEGLGCHLVCADVHHHTQSKLFTLVWTVELLLRHHLGALNCFTRASLLGSAKLLYNLSLGMQFASHGVRLHAMIQVLQSVRQVELTCSTYMVTLAVLCIVQICTKKQSNVRLCENSL